jgi:hypothetical protein
MFPSPHPSLPPLPLNKPPQVAMLFLRRRCCSGHRAPDPHSLVLDSRRACLLVASPLRPMMQGRSISRWQPKPVDTRGGGSTLHPAALFALSMATAMLFPWVRCHSCGGIRLTPSGPRILRSYVPPPRLRAPAPDLCPLSNPRSRQGPPSCPSPPPPPPLPLSSAGFSKRA